MWGALAEANASWCEHFLGLRGDHSRKHILHSIQSKSCEKVQKLNLNLIL